MKTIFRFVIYLMMFNTSCGQSPSTNALVGTYCFSNANVHDSLYINKDYTYSYKFYATDGQIFKSSGKWEYDSIRSEIAFQDFVFFNNSGADLPAGYWISKVEVTNEGDVRLMYSSENNVYFSKKRN